MVKLSKTKIFLALAVLLCTSSLSAQGESGVRISAASPEKGNDGKFYSEITIQIPEGHYIYANPKGPGTGLATEISLPEGSRGIKLQVRYPEGAEYTASGEKNHVYVYRERVLFPVSWGYAGKPESLSLMVSALLCSSTTCLPVRETVKLSPPAVKNDGSSSLMNRFNAAPVRTGDRAAGNSSASVKGKGETALPEDISFRPEYQEKGVAGLLQAVIFGIIAGLILNFMPCVLPVVSLKIMGFVTNAGEDRKVIALQGLVFSAGILASFLILASLAAFWGYRWGGLFQHRGFLLFMLVLVFSMAMSMFGVFTLNAPDFAGRMVSGNRGKYADAFMKGIAATLLATPCSGPYLGGTLAWAMTGGPLTVFAVFISVGAGMALPYTVLALHPAYIKYIPSPGAWLEIFEKVMAFLLLLTSVYLLGILEPGDRMGAVLFLALFSAALWQYGRWGSAVNSQRTRRVSLAVLAAAGAAAYFISFSLVFGPSGERAYEKNLYSAERLLANRERGVISVVEFTADWCPNCKLVEKVTLQSREVSRLLSGEGIDFMVADITQKGTPAEGLLKKLGSESIPFLALFPAGKGFDEPVCLRDIYGKDEVRQALKSVSEKMKK